MPLFETLSTTPLPLQDEAQRKLLRDQAKQLTDAQWMVENRWLASQPQSTYRNILDGLQHLSVPLSKINMHLLVQHCYASMEGVQVGALDGLKLPKRVYSLLLMHIYEHQQCPHTLERMSNCVFETVVKRSDSIPLLFDRGHMLIFFEKLYCIGTQLSTVDEMCSFRVYVCSLAHYNRCINQKMTSYKKKMYKKLYNALIYSLFQSAFMRGQFKNVDVLYEHNRCVTRGCLQKVLLCASHADIEAMWHTGENIRQFCIDNMLKWKHLPVQSPLWVLCKGHIDDVLIEMQRTPKEDILIKLHLYTNSSAHKTFLVLKKYPRVTQRIIVSALFQCVEDSGQTPALKTYAQEILTIYSKHVLVVTNYDTNTLLFYKRQGYAPRQLFNIIVPFAHLPAKVLEQWIQVFGPLPIQYLEEYFTKITDRVTFTRVQLMLQYVNLTLRAIMAHDTVGWEKSDVVLRALSVFLVRFEKHLKLRTHTMLRTFARCLLVNAYMHHSPVYKPTSLEPDADGYIQHTSGVCCSICYEESNTEHGTLRTLACGHCFHTHCMSEMARHTPHTQTDMGKCPYCMTPLTVESLPALKEKSGVLIVQHWLDSHLGDTTLGTTGGVT